MSAPHRLHGEQSASPGTCGSCALFRREPNSPVCAAFAPKKGECAIKFPTWMRLLHVHAEVDKAGQETVQNSSDWRRVEDTDTCTFWRPSGLTYVKDQTWTVAS